MDSKNKKSGQVTPNNNSQQLKPLAINEDSTNRRKSTKKSKNSSPVNLSNGHLPTMNIPTVSSPVDSPEAIP